MGNSLLKKEFAEKDIKRLRALIVKNYGASTQDMVGYEKSAEQDHKEGDVWEEKGKTWTISDGVKMSVPRLQKARKIANIPLACPQCGKALNTRLDRKVYPLHGICFNCLTKFEDDLKRAGLYREYERQIVAGNIKGFVLDLEDRLRDMSKDLVTKTVTENGEVEDWGKTSTKTLTTLKDWVKVFKDKLSE